MSSIFFDPAAASGNQAGTRSQSKSHAYTAGNVSFDALLAKSQSSYESGAAFRTEKYDNERGYDSDSVDDFDSELDSDVRTESTDEDYSNWDDDDDLVAAEPEDDVVYSEADHSDNEADTDGNEIAAAQPDNQIEPDDAGRDGDQVAAAAVGTSGSADRTATGNSANATANANRPAHPTAQAGPTTAPATAQQASGQATSGGNQAANATASVVNNSLVSQSNTALTTGAAVIALQSVDSKTGGSAGKVPAFDALAAAQTAAKPEAAAEPNSNQNAAQLAKLQQIGNSTQNSVGQPSANIPGIATPGIGAPASAPGAAGNLSSGAETANNPTGLQTAATSTGSPTFTSLAPVGGVVQTASATAAGAAATGNASAGAAAPSEQVAVEIHKGITAGKDTITIKLNPAELGKIDVKMELSDDGTLRAVIAVDKPETLDLLQRDAKGLERALQNAGLQADSGSLNFSLRGEGENQANGNDMASGSKASSGTQGEDAAPDDPTAGAEQNNRSSHDGALDISV
ncbi:flagellar hook-length control protein FliK [Pelagibius sp. Alg239-R121]|uniref:flagellar hook-length control protein FliK n=1 Tax=Pelagibius sp. Alg239-R121 TaxID=2993448 RepID=UPI0024A652BC|nr:flagellar hook-length control protein FliK [Pelagibius sp. Alg239-R121]